MKQFLTAVAVLSLLLTTPRRVDSQSADARVQEIKDRLAKIESSDPVERIVISQDLLTSDDATLRSLALPKILGSRDGRVRAIGFAYLIDVQKRFVVTIAVPDKKTPMQGDALRAALTAMPIFVADVSTYDKSLRQFSGAMSIPSSFTGNIATDGLTFLFQWAGPCRLQFRTATIDNLTGSLDCGPDSLLATSPLP